MKKLIRAIKMYFTRKKMYKEMAVSLKQLYSEMDNYPENTQRDT